MIQLILIFMLHLKIQFYHFILTYLQKYFQKFKVQFYLIIKS